MSQPLFGNNDIVILLDEWKVIDRWWDPAEIIERHFIEVLWYGRKFVFAKEIPDTVWRIYKETKWPSQSSKSNNE